MNQLIRNRLIGGAVLVFAGALFIPAILNPSANTLTNPELAISIQSTKSTIAGSDDKNIELVSSEQNGGIVVKPLVLESSDGTEKSQVVSRLTAQKSSKQPKLIAISLESAGARPSDSVSKKSIVSVPKADVNTPVSWLRVGSFSSRSNAEKLAANLKTSRYPVKIETIIVDGKSFQRVLVGPFSNENNMAKVMKGIQKKGYSPSVQR